MTHASPREFAEYRSKHYTRHQATPEPKASVSEPELRTLLGPTGEVLRTFSNKPPIGFRRDA